MSATDDINRLLRYNNRYTGDGLPDEPTNAPLPVGLAPSGKYPFTNKELIEAILLALSGGTGNPATVPQLVQDVENLQGDQGPGTAGDVDPTTLRVFLGTHRFWQGSIYYWTGTTYALVQTASQIDPDLNESRVYAVPNHFKRNDTDGAWELEATTTGTETETAPGTPTGTASDGDNEITVAITAPASSGSSALSKIWFIWTPPGSSEPEEVDTGLTADGTFTLPVFDDLVVVQGRLVAENAQGIRSSPPFELNEAKTFGPPDRATLVTADVTEGKGQVTFDVQAVDDNGLPITDVIAIFKRRA